MNHELRNAMRNLPRHGQHNVAKILCLAFGIAISSVIIAEIYFEQSYDTFFPAHDRTYKIYEVFSQNGDNMEFDCTSGGTSFAIKDFSPQVEAATRYTEMTDEAAQINFTDGRHVSAGLTLADSCFFDVIPDKIIRGNAKDVLSQPFYCMVSSKVAEKLGGDVVGKRFTVGDFPGRDFIIGGVFEEYPYNSSFHSLQVLVSLKTLRHTGNDGSDNLVGNDRYRSYIRLTKGQTPDNIRPNVMKMIKERFPLKEMKKAGVKLDYKFKKASDVYTSDPYIQKMGWIMALLAFVLLFSAVMNYLLIVVGNMINRSREMAIRKCYGAGRGRIRSIVFSEALVHVVIALIIAALLLLACKGTIEQFISAPLDILLFNRGSWILLVVILIVLLIGGIVPGMLYSSVPVALAFRGYANTRNRWKLVLLSIQFVAAGLLISLLVVIQKQYAFMTTDNPGYDYANVAVLNIDGINSNQIKQCIAELKRIPDVSQVSTASCVYDGRQSGNNISLPGDDRELFNSNDLYFVSAGYLKLMGMKIIDGQNFMESADSMNNVLVSSDFADNLRTTVHCKGSVVGRRIIISEHSDRGNHPFVIRGVYNKIRVGSFSEMEKRPTMMFYVKDSLAKSPNILIRFDNLTAESMKTVNDKALSLFPTRDVRLRSYSTLITDMYRSQNSFRSAVLVAGAATFLIALFGLIGYASDEVNRRHKEIAIRKVNGALLRDILRIFVRDISRIAVPSLMAGGVAAWFISSSWLQSFSGRISLSPLLFIACILILFIVIVAVVVANCYKVANSNPVEYLKQE